MGVVIGTCILLLLLLQLVIITFKIAHLKSQRILNLNGTSNAVLKVSGDDERPHVPYNLYCPLILTIMCFPFNILMNC